MKDNIFSLFPHQTIYSFELVESNFQNYLFIYLNSFIRLTNKGEIKIKKKKRKINTSSSYERKEEINDIKKSKYLIVRYIILILHLLF